MRHLAAFAQGVIFAFFHQAALSGDPALEDFFTEEYALNHLIHTYPKPTIAFMDGIVMGGGMGISQGASHRIVTERTKMAMPETGIGLFPDVGGGYFLSRCPGRVGEYLALTGQLIQADDAVTHGLADVHCASADLPALWAALPQLLDAGVETNTQAAAEANLAAVGKLIAMNRVASSPAIPWAIANNRLKIDAIFSLPSVAEMCTALDADADADASPWATETVATLRKRSPLMLHVVLELIRRARSMGLADDLRLERDLVRHCFHTAHLQRAGLGSETVEGIRALAVDKDHAPRWNPARIEDVTAAMVEPFFKSPWPVNAHPLRGLV